MQTSNEISAGVAKLKISSNEPPNRLILKRKKGKPLSLLFSESLFLAAINRGHAAVEKRKPTNAHPIDTHPDASVFPDIHRTIKFQVRLILSTPR
jgi:hypothetical protein